MQCHQGPNVKYFLKGLSISLSQKYIYQVNCGRTLWRGLVSSLLYVLARVLQNSSSWWPTTSPLNSFWVWGLAHIYKLSKDVDYLVSCGVTFFSLLLIYSSFICCIKYYSWWLLNYFAFKNTVIVTICIALCRPGLSTTAQTLTLITIIVPTWLYAVNVTTLTLWWQMISRSPGVY